MTIEQNLAQRKIVPYVRRDDISWWAGCRYETTELYELPYIRETSCMTRIGAVNAARRLAKKARKLRDQKLIGVQEDVGPAQ